MVMAHPYWLLLILLLPVSWLVLRHRGFVGHSDLGLLEGVPGNAFLHRLPLLLITLAFLFLLVALAGPERLQLKGTETIRSRDIIVAVDKSGSMARYFDDTIPPLRKGDPAFEKEFPSKPPAVGDNDADGIDNLGHRRIDAAQAAVIRFVLNRHYSNSGDRIGVLVFDTSPYWSWPLTNDLKMIYRKALFISQNVGGGTNFGEWPPGPIDAAAEHFDELGRSSTRVLIMVTDGEDELSAGALFRLSRVISSRGIHFYVIGIGPTLAKQNVDIFKLTHMVGGHVYRVENARDLSRCFDSIDKMEQSLIQVSTEANRKELFPWFAGLSALLFLSGVLAEALIVSL